MLSNCGHGILRYTMNILISYSTNSGSTYVVARTIAASLEKKHTTILKPASLAHELDVEKADIILLGSPSWDVNGKEGQPHETMLALVERLSTISLEQKRLLLFGCGDSSYTHFCGAVDELEIWAKTTKATLLLPSLRLDEFFFHEEKNITKTKAWIENAMKHW